MKYKHYHFIGIGGIGMGALASLALDQGVGITGSDIHENEMIRNLRSKGAIIWGSHSAENLTDDVECVVYSSAINKENVEFVEALNRQRPMMKRAEFLAELMENHFSITVAGAHGKTTTTSFISHILDFAQLNPTTAVGGIVLGTSLNAKMGDGRYFIAEADESDGSFLKFSPMYSVITNIDFEHVDHYKNMADVIQTYEKFIAKTKVEGCLFVNGDDESLLKLVKSSKRNYCTFGFQHDNEMIAENIHQISCTMTFDCVFNKKDLGQIVLNLPGKHNVHNALAAIYVAQELGIKFEVIQKALCNFNGVKRRFQIKGEVDGILVIDDYAHHPTEMKVTLETAQNLGRKRVVAVFQPHRYSRLSMFMDDFSKSLKGVDVLLITDVYAASEKPISGITAQALVSKINDDFQMDASYANRCNIIEQLNNVVQPNDTVLFLGAGDITVVSDDYVKTLKERQIVKTS